MRRLLAISLVFLGGGCGSDAPPPCKGICTPSNWTTLDILAGAPGGRGLVDGPASRAHLDSPWTMAFDGQGRLYLADGELIRSLDLATLALATLAGAYSVPGTQDGPGSAARFDLPSGLAVAAGTLYIADTENHTLRKLDLATDQVSTLGGAPGVAGSDDLVGTAARFHEPEGIALDGMGNLYIGDTDNRTIRVMNVASGMVTTRAGMTLMAGTVDGAGAAARLTCRALVFDGAGTLYFIDSGNNSLRKLTMSDNMVSTVAVIGMELQGLALVGTDLYASTTDGRLFRVAIATGTITLYSGQQNTQGFVDGPVAGALYSGPAGLLSDGQGSLYVADLGNYALRKIDLATGMVSTTIGVHSLGSADGSGMAARFGGPQGLCADTTGLVYVADTKNDTLRSVARATGEVKTVAGKAGESGSADGAGDAARFDAPAGLALDSAGHLFVADSGNHRLRRVDLATAQVTTLGLMPATPTDSFAFLGYPNGLAVDGDSLFVSDYQLHTILQVDLPTGAVHTVAGQPTLPGAVDGTGDAARFHSPGGLYADGQGHLFVADVLNQAVRKIDLGTRKVTTLAGMLGSQGSADGTGSAAGFTYPSHLTGNGLGDLYVSDSLNDTIRHVGVASGAVSTVIGVAKRLGVAPGPLPAQLGAPAALVLTPEGELILVSENALLRAH